MTSLMLVVLQRTVFSARFQMVIPGELFAFQETRDVGCFTRSNRNRPAGKLFFDITGDGGRIARDNQFCMFDLVHDAAFLDEHADIIAGKFSGGSGRHDRQAFGVLDKQVGGHPAAFNFS